MKGKRNMHKLDTEVFVPLLRLQSEQVEAEFKNKLQTVLGIDNSKFKTPEANHELLSDSCEEPGERVVIMPCVKGAQRMKDKIRGWQEMQTTTDDSERWPYIKDLC